jgi:hypothetical protein
MDIALSRTTHDLALAGNDLTLVTGAADTVQSIRIRLLTIKAEWFLDDTIGWLSFTEVYGKRSQQALAGIRATILSEIQNTPGVLANSAVIDALDLNAATRTLSCTWHARALDGEAISDTVTG